MISDPPASSQRRGTLDDAQDRRLRRRSGTLALSSGCSSEPSVKLAETTVAVTASPSPSSEPETEPEPVDTDGDEVPDRDDLRPKDPEVQTRKDIDTDGDGFPDFKDDFPRDAAYSKDTDGDGVPDAKDAFPSDPSRSKITLAMENALESAQDYLSYSAFSRQGLIEQLSSKYGEGFTLGDATWAVGQLDVDWKQQAVRSARDYLDYSSFSRHGLIDQLSSPYGESFTVEEAIYAVDKIGL